MLSERINPETASGWVYDPFGLMWNKKKYGDLAIKEKKDNRPPRERRASPAEE